MPITMSKQAKIDRILFHGQYFTEERLSIIRAQNTFILITKYFFGSSRMLFTSC
jgi:hypothetical protein